MTLANPVMTASGTFGYGGEFRDLVDLRRLGAIIVKGLSRTPTPGNPPPRIVETPCGMLNAIGLENIGIDAFRSTRLKFLRRLGVPMPATRAMYACARFLDDARASQRAPRMEVGVR